MGEKEGQAKDGLANKSIFRDYTQLKLRFIKFLRYKTNTL